jgi:hypothetical protein
MPYVKLILRMERQVRSKGVQASQTPRPRATIIVRSTPSTTRFFTLTHPARRELIHEFGVHHCSHPYPRHRQRPMACQLCRERKLRCNRQFPCSNCTARGVSCQAPRVQQPGLRQSAAVERTLPAAVPTALLQVTNEELLRRLETVEALLTSQAKERESAHFRPESGRHNENQIPSKVQNLLVDALILERHCMSPTTGVSSSRSFSYFLLL